MSGETPGRITQLLHRAAAGDHDAEADLLRALYDELHRLARRHMRNERRKLTLQPTALVNEAYVRLMRGADAEWTDRVHFFAAASNAMRRILVDHARRRQSLKRGGGIEHEELHETAIVLTAPPDELLAVHEALDKLASEDPSAAELVKLRYFVGMTMEEAAMALGLAKRTAENLWTYARVWLHCELNGWRERS